MRAVKQGWRAQMNQVIAAVQVTEEGYRDADEFVHAEPGDRGEVLEFVENGDLIVRWSRHDSIAQVHPTELVSVDLVAA